MKDYSELKRMAEDVKGWDKMTECWPSDENGPDWQVGRLDEEDNRWPLMTVDTEQYDQEQDAPKVAQYYAAANPVAVLALISDNERLKVDLREQKDAKLGLSWAIGEIMGERDKLKIEVEVMRNLARELRGSAECTNVDHCKSEQHDTNEPCKVLARIDAAMSNKE